MYKTFINIAEFCTSWCNQNWLVLVAFIVVDLMILGGFFLTVRGRIFKTQRTIDYYNKTIRHSGLKTHENFRNLDKTIRQNKTVITDAWTAAYPDNICFFVQSVSYTNIIGQLGTSHSRRNFIFGLALLFAAFSMVIILGLLSAVGYLAFVLPIIVFVLAFLTEAVFAFIDDRNTKKLVKSYNEFFALVTKGIRDVYGVRVCHCQCVTESFNIGKTTKAALSVRHDGIRHTSKQDGGIFIKEKTQTSKSATSASKEKPKSAEAKIIATKTNEQKSIKAQSQKQTAKVQAVPLKKEPQQAEQKKEVIKKQIVKKETEKAAAPVKRQEQNSAVTNKNLGIKSNEIISTKAVVKTEKPKTIKTVAKTEIVKKTSGAADKTKTSITTSQSNTANKIDTANEFDTSSKFEEKVKVALYMTDTQTASLSADNKKVQVLDTNRPKVVTDKKQVLAVSESTKKELSTDAKLESLSQRLSAIREVTSTVTTETIEAKTVSETNTVAHTQTQARIKNSDSQLVPSEAVKVEKQIVKKVEKRGKYDEDEVISALDGLYKSMNAMQGNEDDAV